MQVELKYVDVSGSGSMNTTLVETLLNGLTQGTTGSTRVGTQISVVSLELWATAKTDTDGVEQFGRFLLVLDTQTRGQSPTASGFPVLTSTSVNSPPTMAAGIRYDILCDKRFAIGHHVTTGTETSRVFYEIVDFTRPLVVQYNSGNAGTVADISQNSLYLVYLGTEAPGTTDIVFDYYCRIKYFDY